MKQRNQACLASANSVRAIAAGFTLVEVLVVLAITSVLASIALPLSELSYQRNKEEQLRVRLRDIRDAIDAYKQAVDEGRILRRADESGYPPTLNVLVDGVPDVRRADRRRLYFLRRVPRDPFSSDRDLPPELTWRTRSYASPAEEPMPGKDVYDVISSANMIGMNGVPYDQW